MAAARSADDLTGMEKVVYKRRGLTTNLFIFRVSKFNSIISVLTAILFAVTAITYSAEAQDQNKAANIDSLGKSFVEYSCTGGKWLIISIPRDQLATFGSNVVSLGPDYVKPITNSHPDGVIYDDWVQWCAGIDCAINQLRWQLVTDPTGGRISLGRYFVSRPIKQCPAVYGTDPCYWNQSNTPANGIVVTPRAGKSTLTCLGVWLPALSYRTYFDGKTVVLMDFHRDKRVEVKMLSSSLDTPNTLRLQEALQSLNGHPVVTFPAYVHNNNVSILCEMTFDKAATLARWSGRDFLTVSGEGIPIGLYEGGQSYEVLMKKYNRKRPSLAFEAQVAKVYANQQKTLTDSYRGGKHLPGQ